MSNKLKATIALMLVTIFSKILGFGRELVLTYTYGATSIADVYITSTSIPNVLFASVGTALATTFIPLFYEVDKTEGREKSIKFANNVFNMIIIISLVLAILGFIYAEILVKIFAINFTEDKLILAVEFTRIMIFGVIFIGLSQMMSSWLQINGKFNIPGMVGFPYNICIICSIIISIKGNIKAMAIGTLIGIISQFIFQLPFSVKCGYKYRPYINLKDEYIKKMVWLIVPVFIGVGVNQMNAVIDRSLASTLGDGIITVLNSASRLNGFVLGLFIATIATVIYPTLSELSTSNNSQKFEESVSKCINIVVLLIIPISIGAIVLAEPVVRIVFERGEFNSGATHMTSIALACYSIGMIGFGLREILSKVFYSLKDTKTPMVNGSLSMVINIILNLVLIKFLGYAGLALATSLSSIICIILLWISLKKKIGYFGQDKIIKTISKSFISSIIMGVVTLLMYKLVSNLLGAGIIKEVMSLSISVGMGALVYIILAIVLEVEEVKLINYRFKNKLKNLN